MKKMLTVLALSALLVTLLPLTVFANETKFEQPLALGTQAAYGVTQDGGLLLWGWESFEPGVSPIRAESIFTYPKQIADNVVSVSAGDHDVLFIRADRSLWQFTTGIISVVNPTQYDHKFNQPGYTPEKIMENVKEASCGYSHYIIIQEDGSTWYWPNYYYNAIPKILENGVQSSSASAYSLIVDADGGLWGIGSNKHHALGVEIEANEEGAAVTDAPVKIMDDVVYAHAFDMTSFAIKKDGSLWAWGDNRRGVILGAPKGEDVKEPIKIMDDVKMVGGGFFHVAVLKTDGSVLTWGANELGQLGDGSKTERMAPQKVMENAAYVSANLTATYVLQDDGSLWFAGENKNAVEGDVASYADFTKMRDGVAAPGGTFSFAPFDLPSDWAIEAVNTAKAEKLVPAELQTAYQSDITRGEFAQLMVSLAEKQTGKSVRDLVTEKGLEIPEPFEDMGRKDILSLVSLGIIEGVGENKFDPHGLITREQAAAMLERTMKALGFDGQPGDHVFADQDQISDWALASAQYCYANEMIHGIGENTFAPKAGFTREMAFVIVARMVGIL